MRQCLKVLLLGIIAWNQPIWAGSFLFDYTKDETAGNADWIVDDDWPQPLPVDPAGEEDWLGALSSWGVTLAQLGHRVRTLPPGHVITFGNTQDSLDLMYFDVFILCEPQNPFTSSEIQAIVEFVAQGGGLFLVANHYASDRNNNGWDAPRIFNTAGFDTLFGIHFHGSGEPHNNIWDAPDSNVTVDPDDPIIHGPMGDVGAIGYYAGTVMSLWNSWNPFVRGHIWMTGAPHGLTDVTLATSRYGQGRIVGLGDSSPADDGTGTPGNNLYDGWHALSEDNDIAILNACMWLLGLTGNQAPWILDLQQIPLFPTSQDTVNVSARITDDSQVLVAKLFYQVTGAPWMESLPDSVSADRWYFHIVPVDSGNTVSYFLWAQDDSLAVSVSETLSYTVYGISGLPLQGFTLIQENSHREYVFGDVTVPPGGLVVLARNATQAQFETFWNVTLSDSVVFINTQGSFPVINGDETFVLMSVQGDTVDGPTIPMSSGISLQRINGNAAADSSSWIEVSDSLATPGSATNFNGPVGLWITEISDASGTGNYVYEFLELAYMISAGEVQEDEDAHLALRIVPNPGGDVVWIKGVSRYAKVQIFDSSGRLRLEKMVEPPRGRLTLRGIPPGLYFLRVGRRALPTVKLR